MPRCAEATRHQHARDTVQGSADVVRAQSLGVDPADADGRAPARPAGMTERLGHREVGVGQLDVLADERDVELRLGPLDALHERSPGDQVGRLGGLVETQPAHHQVAQPDASNSSGTS